MIDEDLNWDDCTIKHSHCILSEVYGLMVVYSCKKEKHKEYGSRSPIYFIEGPLMQLPRK